MRHHEARVRETAEEREARLARRRQQDSPRRELAQGQETPEQQEAMLSNWREEHTTSLPSPIIIPLITSLH